MAGGILQLVASSTGHQSSQITTKPEISYFQSRHHQHTNFAMESVPQAFEGTVDYGETITATLTRTAEMVSRMFIGFEVTEQGENFQKELFGSTPPTSSKTPPYIGYRLIDRVTLLIGSKIIDEQYGQWMELWSQLSVPDSKASGHFAMVSGSDTRGGNYDKSTPYWNEVGDVIFVPLYFWFCKYPGLAIPLISLQFSDIKVRVKLASKPKNLHESHHPDTAPAAFTATLWVDYIYIDEKMKKRFMRTSDHLIEQVQAIGLKKATSNSSCSVSLKHLGHPVKELVWGIWSNDNQRWLRSLGDDNKILLNGQNLISEHSADFFRLIQPFQHHTSCPSSNYAYAYSFALFPEQHQPSGTCNFSELNKTFLKLDMSSFGNKDALYNGADTNPVTNADVYVFATNYNVLSFTANGTAKLRYGS